MAAPYCTRKQPEGLEPRGLPDEPVERFVPVAGTGGGEGLSDGVSLHSHTNQSKETLDFISELSKDWSFLQPVIRWGERRSKRLTGIDANYARAYWTPPLTPSLAFDLERKQIEEKLQIQGLVSITDHDEIDAPMLLRTVPSSRHIPVSVEWTVPFGVSAFHLGFIICRARPARSGWSAWRRLRQCRWRRERRSC